MKDRITWVIVSTLASVMVAVVVAMLIGLFDDRVDNAEIFKILGPAFSMIVGAFVGYLGGRNDSRRDDASNKTSE